MNITKELLEKAKQAKTAEELLAMAKEENVELTEEQSAKAFAELNKTGELSNVENDAGIIYDSENDLVIVFMSQNLSDTSAAQNTIASLSREIYDYYN